MRIGTKGGSGTCQCGQNNSQNTNGESAVSKVLDKVKAVARDVAHGVRDAGREVRKNFSAEYVHTTVEGIVDDLEARYPQRGRGEAKFRIARTLLRKILGTDYADSNWQFIGDLIGDIVALRKSDQEAA
jgi:uncharacterized protein YbcI